MKTPAEILASLEPCPGCGGKDYAIARDLNGVFKATRRCPCGQTWYPPPPAAPKGPSDLERVRDAFKHIGLPFIEAPFEYPERWAGANTELRIDGDGYCGFYHTFAFDANGKLVNHGGWE